MAKNNVRIIVLFVSVVLFTGLLVYYFYPEKRLPEGIHIDKLVVYKSKRQLLAYSDGKIIKKYTISLGGAPVGHKRFEGDKKTPEGIYYIHDKNPDSGYYKNLGVSYPNENDAAYAKQHQKSPGGDIKIHGLRNRTGIVGKFHRWKDWTLGCIALTNREIDELYASVPVGTVIEIMP